MTIDLETENKRLTRQIDLIRHYAITTRNEDLYSVHIQCLCNMEYDEMYTMEPLPGDLWVFRDNNTWEFVSAADGTTVD